MLRDAKLSAAFGAPDPAEGRSSFELVTTLLMLPPDLRSVLQPSSVIREVWATCKAPL